MTGKPCKHARNYFNWVLYFNKGVIFKKTEDIGKGSNLLYTKSLSADSETGYSYKGIGSQTPV